MTTHFDFSTYHPAPKGWRILQADRQCLMLERSGGSRTYYITCPKPSEFHLCFTSEIQRERQFIMRTDSFLNILRAIGAIRIDDLKPHGVQSATGNSALI